MDEGLSPKLDLDKFFEMTADILVIAGDDGYFKKVSPSFCNTFGYSEEELLATPFLDFVHPDYVAGTLAELEGLVRGELTIDFENLFRQADGTYRSLSWSARPDPETGLLYCVARDVTELNYTRRRLQQIYDALTAETIFAVTDCDGQLIEVNDRYCEISGYTPDELIGKTPAVLSSGRHPPEFFEEMWTTIASGRVWSGLIENRRKDGSLYFVQSTIIPMNDDQGEVSNYLAFHFDTTRHVQVKRELSKTLQMLNLTGEIAKVGGWEMNVADGEITWTDETYAIFGIPRQPGRPAPTHDEGLQLFVEEDRHFLLSALERCVSHQTPYSLDLRIRRQDGEIRWVNTSGYPNSVDGQVVTVFGAIQDIDERKKTQEAYEAERMKSIQSSKLASLGEMAAGVAHEINNPLSVIYGSTQLMARYLEDPERMVSRIAEIEKSSRRIERIVNSLRKFSRSDEGHNFERHDLNELVREALILVDAKSKRHMTALTYQSTIDDAWIRCDEVEIEQVVVNLINNAIDAAKDSDDARVDVRLGASERGFELSVTDTGPGLPDDIRERIFEPFFTTKRGGEGTGLGLSITKGILDDHNATIVLDEDAEHTRFVVTFQPWLDEEEAA